MVRLLDCAANVLLAVLALGLVAVLAVVVLWLPWWLTSTAAVALVAARPRARRR